MKTEMEYKVVELDTSEEAAAAAAKRAASMDQLTEDEINQLNELVLAQRKKYLEHLRSKGRRA